MKNLWIGTVLCGTVVFGIPTPAGAATVFTTTDLHPNALQPGPDFGATAFADSAATSVSGGQQGGIATDDVGLFHGILWTGAAASAIDLTPSGFAESGVNGISAGQQVGFATQNGGRNHAALWTGAAASYIDLHQSGASSFSGSSAFGVAGGQQVGNSNSFSFPMFHAVLWSGTSASAVDLHPAFASGGGSHALATDGSEQVGFAGGEGTGGQNHATLWSGTAASAVDLHPVGFLASQSLGIFGGQQVGNGTLPGSIIHALLWTGSAASAVDLNPIGFDDSGAFAVSNGEQVGEGHMGGHQHALLWMGNAASVIDLNLFLPAGFTDAVAQGIDADGNIVGSASGPATGGVRHAFLWAPSVPEPSSLLLLVSSILVVGSAVTGRNWPL